MVQDTGVRPHSAINKVNEALFHLRFLATINLSLYTLLLYAGLRNRRETKIIVDTKGFF